MRGTGIGHRLTWTQSLANAMRRRLWNKLYAPAQHRLGSFFLDPRDHIGKDRLVTGDRYEAAGLLALDHLISSLQLGGGLALDVGANIGNHACWFASRFTHVICVEPGPVASLVLEANLMATGRRNWEVVRCALGDRDGTGVLLITNDVNLGSSRVTSRPDGAGDFPVRTGDSVVAAHQGPDARVSLVKLDIEGDELPALVGLRDTLSRHQPLVCVEALESDRWTEIGELMAAAGYDTFLVVAPHRPGHSLLSRWINLVSGHPWTLAPVPRTFPAGGYEMVFCLTPQQARDLEQSQGAGGGRA